MADRPVHPVAALFPMLPDDELAELAEDIRVNGLIHPIVLDGDGQLIDGRNRLAACELASVEPRFEQLDGQEPTAYILSANLTRRHMAKGQRAMAAVMAEAFGASSTKTERALAAEQQMEKTNIHRAMVVYRRDPDLAAEVLAGVVTVNRAYETVQQQLAQARGLVQDRALLRDLAPDLDADVEAEVLALADALYQAQERQRKQEEEQRDARVLLDRVLQLVVPRQDDDFICTWAEHLGKVTPTVVTDVLKAAAALSELAMRLEEQ